MRKKEKKSKREKKKKVALEKKSGREKETERKSRNRKREQKKQKKEEKKKNNNPPRSQITIALCPFFASSAARSKYTVSKAIIVFSKFIWNWFDCSWVKRPKTIPPFKSTVAVSVARYTRYPMFWKTSESIN